MRNVKRARINESRRSLQQRETGKLGRVRKTEGQSLKHRDA